MIELIGWIIYLVVLFYVGWIIIIFSLLSGELSTWAYHAIVLYISFFGSIALAAIAFTMWEDNVSPKAVLEKALTWFFSLFFSGRHYAKHVIHRRDAAEEFARIMRAQHFDHIRARELFPQMGWTRRILWSTSYKEHVKEAQRLSEMVEKQTEVLHADAKLGERVFNRERERP